MPPSSRSSAPLPQPACHRRRNGRRGRLVVDRGGPERVPRRRWCPGRTPRRLPAASGRCRPRQAGGPIPPSSTRWAHSAGERPSWGCRRGAPSSFYLSAARRLWQQLPMVIRSGDSDAVRAAAAAVLHVVCEAVAAWPRDTTTPADRWCGGRKPCAGRSSRLHRRHHPRRHRRPRTTNRAKDARRPDAHRTQPLTPRRSAVGPGAGLRRWRRPSLRSSRTAWSR